MANRALPSAGSSIGLRGLKLGADCPRVSHGHSPLEAGAATNENSMADVLLTCDHAAGFV